MNEVQKSLENNKKEILAALPKEFHADLDAYIASAAPAPKLTDEEAVAAIKAELVEHPDVDESAAAEALSDIKAPEAPGAPTETELKVAEAAALKSAEAMGPHQDSAD